MYVRVVGLICVVLSGCSGESESVSGSKAGLRPDPACPDRRFIGVRRGSACPAGPFGLGGVWRLSSPFESVYASGPLPPRLEPYCQYDWVSRTGASPDVAALPAEGGRTWDQWLDRDCHVVAPLSNAFHVTLAPSLRDAFLAQVDWSDDLPVDPVHPEAGVLVSVIDSSAGAPGNGQAHGANFLHGYEVARVVRELACRDPDGTAPDRGCMAYTDHPLALPRISTTQVDYGYGGYFGSQGDLARAIFDGLERFDENALLGVSRHVLNLSIGWSPRYGGASPNDPRTSAPIRAVFDVLAEARCRGALIVAAAGNDEGGTSHRTGLMYPAAWEDESVACDSTTHDRLLVAVGGVDGVDHPLENGRPEGHPRLVAPADHVSVLHRSSSTLYTDAASGTSMAAAVMSAASAVVWGYAPSLDADQVRDVVYDAAVDLGYPADVCGTGPCGVRRISICRALHEVCATGAPSCPERLPDCPPSFAGRDARPPATYGGVDLVQTVDALVTQSHVFTGADLGIFVECGGARVFSWEAAPAYPCPFQQREAQLAKPWVDPQPSEPVCPHCFLRPTSTELVLYIEVNEALEGKAVDVVLRVKTTVETRAYVLKPTVWSAGDRFKITDIPVPPGYDLKAALEYNMEDGSDKPFSGSEPLLVYD